MKQLRREVLEQAFEHLRTCGDGSRECVVYLTGPAFDDSVIDGVIHPQHTASPAGYDLDSEAIAELWTELASEQRSIRVQMHTHPGAAYRSSRDDRLALVHTPGFLSLVIPDFARGTVGFADAHLVERREDGEWIAVRPSARFRLE